MLMRIFLAFLFAATLLSCSNSTPKPPTPTPPVVDAPTMVGNDADAHGCRASAGYQWSALRNECIRLFETGIRLDPKAPELNKSLSAFIVFKSETEDQQAELYLPDQNQPQMLSKVPGNGAGKWKAGDYTLSQWKGMYTLETTGKKVLYEGGLK